MHEASSDVIFPAAASSSQRGRDRGEKGALRRAVLSDRSSICLKCMSEGPRERALLHPTRDGPKAPRQSPRHTSWVTGCTGRTRRTEGRDHHGWGAVQRCSGASRASSLPSFLPYALFASAAAASAPLRMAEPNGHSYLFRRR